MTKKEPKNAELRAIVDRHKLRYKDVAELCHASPYTVRQWLATAGTTGFAPMYEKQLRLLELELPAFLKARAKKSK